LLGKGDIEGGDDSSGLKKKGSIHWLGAGKRKRDLG
jgi:hypothetical protein